MIAGLTANSRRDRLHLTCVLVVIEWSATMDENPVIRRVADRHFEEARREAGKGRLSAWLSGQEDTLLPFESIRSELKQQHPLYKGLRLVPVDKIVGSLGRYKGFNRAFLPLSNSMRERWIQVETLAMERGWPPVELYRVGEIYFVKDGNHRVAIANRMGNETIEAHVWEYPEEVEINPEDSLDEVLIRLGQRNFLEKTRINELIPEHGIEITVPGRYTELLAQIRDLREKLSLVDGEEMSMDDAVINWHEISYLPAVEIIRDSGLLDDFSGRTDTDLFVWMSVHRGKLQEIYGKKRLAELAAELAEKHKSGNFAKLKRRIWQILGRNEPAPLDDIE